MQDILTPQDVAQIFRVSPQTIHRWAQDGLLPAVELPMRGKQQRRMRRYRRADVERLISQQ